MDERSRFCANCPMIPRGVTAELTSIEPITMAELRRYRFAQTFLRYVRLTATVVESDSPTTAMDDTASMLVDTHGKSVQEVSEAVNSCNGPISTTALQKILGIKRRCGAVDNSQEV